LTTELERRNPIAHELLRILKYVYRLGLARGLSTWTRLKVAREPVWIRIPGSRGKVLVRTSSSDIWTYEKIFISREYDLPGVDTNPRVIIDVGANVGYASVFFAERYPEARIIAIEPEEENFSLLQRNTAPYRNVTSLRAALWPHPAAVSIDNPNDASWAFRIRERPLPTGDAVRGISMMELLDEYDIADIDLLKIDIEGAEKEVFQAGCESWLERTRVLVAELHDWMRDGCATAFYRSTSQFPFKHLTSGENVVLIRQSSPES